MVFFLWQPQQTNIGIIHWNRMNQQRLWVAGPIVKRRWSDSHGVNLFYLVCRLAGKWILLLRDKQELLFLLHVLRMVIYLGDLTCGNKVEKGICGFFGWNSPRFTRCWSNVWFWTLFWPYDTNFYALTGIIWKLVSVKISGCEYLLHLYS